MAGMLHDSFLFFYFFLFLWLFANGHFGHSAYKRITPKFKPQLSMASMVNMAGTSHKQPTRDQGFFALMHECRKAAQERASLALAFHLYVNVNEQKPRELTHHDEPWPVAPPDMPHEIFDQIMALVNDLTIDDVLREKQRFANVENITELHEKPTTLRYWRTSLPVRNCFPSFGPSDNGYYFYKSPTNSTFSDGRLSVSFEQQVKPLPPLDKVTWTLHVDMRQVRALLILNDLC